jgi:hypothetical protein
VELHVPDNALQFDYILPISQKVTLSLMFYASSY